MRTRFFNSTRILESNYYQQGRLSLATLVSRAKFDIPHVIPFLQLRGLYFVKWIGYDESDNTWEPIGNLEECRDNLKEFYHQRIKDRESATPVRKRQLEVPPDPRAHFERRSEFIESIFNQPCLSELEKFFVANRKNKTTIWTETDLNQKLDELEKSKAKNEKKLEKVRFQLMMKHVNDYRRKQLERLEQYEKEINKLENPRVSVENNADLEGPPRHMTYVTVSKPSGGIVIPDDPVIGCECDSACSLATAKTCCPHLNSPDTTDFPYTKYGYLRDELYKNRSSGKTDSQ